MEENYVYKKVSSIEFALLGPKTIRKMASAKIVTPELYDKEGYPVDGGLLDVRLGVIDPGLRCKTCGSRLKECIGHFRLHITGTAGNTPELRFRNNANPQKRVPGMFEDPPFPQRQSRRTSEKLKQLGTRQGV